MQVHGFSIDIIYIYCIETNRTDFRFIVLDTTHNYVQLGKLTMYKTQKVAHLRASETTHFHVFNSGLWTEVLMPRAMLRPSIRD